MLASAWAFLRRSAGQVGSLLGVRRKGTLSMSLSYYDLLEAFANPGCAVCNLLLRNADRFLDGFLYERALDPGAHRAFRARRGLCNEHGWQATRYMGSSLSLATLYSTALDEVLKILEEAPLEEAPRLGPLHLRNDRSQSSSLADRLEPVGGCLVCELLAGAEQRYLHTLGHHIADARLREAYQNSDGLCLPHFRQVLRQAPRPSDRELLIAIQKGIWKRLKADLEEFILKNDYRRRGERMGPEGDSWRRVAFRMAGERGVFGPDPRGGS